MAEPTNKVKPQTLKHQGNAGVQSVEGAAAIQAPPYNVTSYQDDKHKSDPMDLVGNYIQPGEILIPANATPEEKFEYYHAILKTVGQSIDSKPGSSHIIGLRGVVKNNDGNIVQTSSAAKYQQALHGKGKLEDQHHFSDSNSARKSAGRQEDTKDSPSTSNDIFVLLTIDKEGNKSVMENMGSIDPAKTGDAMGSAHLMDGTFDYAIGRHSTKIDGHKAEIAKLKEADGKNKQFDVGPKYKGSDRLAYMALVPKGKIKVLRDGVPNKPGADYKDQPESKGYFSKKNIEKYQANPNSDKYTKASSIATNGHLGREDESFSEGCWNLPVDPFMEMMKKVEEQRALKKQTKENYRIKFTLLDASKVGYKLLKTEEEAPRLQKRKDFGDSLNQLDKK